MSKVEELKSKMEKAEEKVEKCKKTIERHRKGLDKKVSALAKKGINVDITDKDANISLKYADGKSTEHYSDIYDIERKQDDIKGATKKLIDAEIVLNNWKKKLEAELEKDNFINNGIPQVIKDFMEEWKSSAYDWHIKKYEAYIEFKARLTEEKLQIIIDCIKTNEKYSHLLNEEGEVKDTSEYALINTRSREIENLLKEKQLDYKSIQSRKANFGGQAILKMDEFYNTKERLEWLEKTLEREEKNKLIDLINRINGVVGTITDASQLRVSTKGNLDGIIIGTDGKAKVETVGAGGYNIQCFHFRTLVHEVK